MIFPADALIKVRTVARVEANNTYVEQQRLVATQQDHAKTASVFHHAIKHTRHEACRDRHLRPTWKW